ncbi:pyridoxal-phosphate dependent enzyme [Candidatus Woesearchaeota archaeon]|nr:pyridoxal-phosphate dependent enzyme [Candidatus Woesearchaeota archaeon]
MKIDYLSCDVCSFRANNPNEHKHPELSIGGVPMNIWTPSYTLPQSLTSDEKGIKRFKNCIPFDIVDKITDEEGSTPLLKLREGIYLKDEGKNPTQSFKDRGMVMLVSDALSSGKNRIAIPSTGNAAISLGYYASKAGLESIVFVPEDTPTPKKEKLEKQSEVIYDQDLIRSYEHFFEFCGSDDSVYNGFPVTNLPYSQGLKTIAYEIFLQMQDIPDLVVIPVGSGGNIVAQYYGFNDLVDMGLTDKMPKFVTVQIQGADPITQGYTIENRMDIVVIENPIESKAEAIASDTCFNFFKIMDILSKTKGVAVSVTDQQIEATHEQELPDLEFSSRSVYASLEELGNIKKEDDIIVLIATADNKNQSIGEGD